MILNNALWNWTSPVWLVAIAILIAYFAVMRRSSARRTWVLAIGLALLVFAYVSPIGVLADGYLFSAHMVQHLLLLLVIPLCLILSVRRVGGVRFAKRGAPYWLPIVCWLCGVGAMWFWHTPRFCSASTQNDYLGVLRDVSFIAAGLAFWWPIFAPQVRFRLPPLDGMAYLFSACLGCTLLGIYITFTTISVCPAFASPIDRVGVLNMLYDMGLTPGVDQNLGGLLMWAPPCALYVSVIVSLLFRWYSEMDNESVPAPKNEIGATRTVKGQT